MFLRFLSIKILNTIFPLYNVFIVLIVSYIFTSITALCRLVVIARSPARSPGINTRKRQGKIQVSKCDLFSVIGSMTLKSVQHLDQDLVQRKVFDVIFSYKLLSRCWQLLV